MTKIIKSNIEGIVSIFLMQFFYLDVILTDFLTYYFIELDYSKDGDKRKQFVECFLENERFVSKAEIFVKIINKKYPQYKNTITKQNFDKIRKLRNDIAHSIVDYDTDSTNRLKSKVNIQKYIKGEIESEQLTYQIIDEAASICGKIYGILNLEVMKMVKRSTTQEALFRAYVNSKKKKIKK